MNKPLSLIALLLLAEGVKADCYYDSYGYYRCTGLSLGARIGIAVALVVLGIILIVAAGVARRRRLQRANKQYAMNYQANMNAAQQGGYGQQPYHPQSGYGQQGNYGQNPYQSYPVNYPPPGGEYQSNDGVQYPAATYQHDATPTHTGAQSPTHTGTYQPPSGVPPQSTGGYNVGGFSAPTGPPPNYTSKPARDV